MAEVRFVKYNRTRDEKFQIKTAIMEGDGIRYVEKSALNDEGIPHIRSFEEKYRKLTGQSTKLRFVEPEISGDGRTARFPYLQGRTLAELLGEYLGADAGDVLGDRACGTYEVETDGAPELKVGGAPESGTGGAPESETSGAPESGTGGAPIQALLSPQPESFQQRLTRALDLIFDVRPETMTKFHVTPEFLEVFGAVEDDSRSRESLFAQISGPSYAVSNIDALFENMLLTGDGVCAIDYEWVFDFPIPARFLRFRTLYYFYQKYHSLMDGVSLEQFLEPFDIEESVVAPYLAMERSFQNYVHGENQRIYQEDFMIQTKTVKDLEWVDKEFPRVKAELAEKDTALKKIQEVKRLTDNHVANLEVIIADLRHEVEEMGKTLTYLNRHEALIFKLRRKLGQVFNRCYPKGSRKRKILSYCKNTVFHPGQYLKLYTTPEGKNRIKGDFEIGEEYLNLGKLIFPEEEHPTVSVIIPVYNQIHYTYLCLASILEHTRDVSYEVIIADDVSTDATEHLGEFVEHVTICRGETNLGFLRNCNHAAKAARGQYVMFLNNDTQVTEGWLSSLVQLIESDATIGMVGSKLVYPDGRLQEAGGIIWSDGSGWNYGRLDNPDKAEYNYVKDVDYISGAAILLSRALWEQIGGFDERFAPAYCEDSDLAFEVRKAGYRVVYQPLSKVIHFEGISNGTDVNGSGLKRYQVENSEKLKDKWKEEFKNQCVNIGNPNPFRARERSMGKPIILVIDHYVPTFDKDAGSKTTFQYLKMFLKKGYVVKFVGDNYLHEEPYTTVLQQMGIEVLYGQEYLTGIWDWLDRNGREISVAYLNRPHIATRYVDYIAEHTDIKIIYYGHDLHFLRELREYELTGDPKKKRESEYWKSIEFTLMRKAAVSYYPSYVEEEAIHEIDESVQVKAITAYVYEDFLEELNEDFERREGLLFVGGFAHPPNADAVLWFAREVFPLIRQKLDVNFYVVGSRVTDEIKALERPGNGIVVKGFVSEAELTDLYRNCRMVVVPLRYGAGVKGKVVEAIYNAAPIVTTSVGSEGIPDVEEVLIVRDEPAEFASAVTEAYGDIQRLRELGRKTQDYIRRYFSVDAAWDVIRDDFEK